MADGAKSKVESIKEESGGLRGSLAEEMASGAPEVGEEAKTLLKFHGLYQQDDRDARRAQARDKSYSFMVRSKIPGGRLGPDAYLIHDELARRRGNGTLRVTTRQDFQIHGVLKGDVAHTLREIDRALLTTLGACGDLVRNVMFCPLPFEEPVRKQIDREVDRFTRHFFPRTTAYHEIWLDGERWDGGGGERPAPARDSAAGEEPIYGAAYLPRKFKIGFAFPGDNCVDVYTQDVGLVPVVEDGLLRGANVLVGGGQGMTHNKPETFPRLGSELGFVPVEHLLEVVEQIVLVHRDHGDRKDRRHARLKYLVHDWGIGRFREEVGRRLGWRLAESEPVPPFDLQLHLGWHSQGDGRWCLGVPIENGRIADSGSHRTLTGLREAVVRFRPGVRLTPNQDVLLTDVPLTARRQVEAVLRDHGVSLASDMSAVRRHAMACPALPTCGLALAEAERALPAVIDGIESQLARLGLARERFTVRMTGCPNGCARPYVADLAFVGRSLDRYLVLVGGRRDGTRLNRAYRDLVPRDKLVETVAPLLRWYRDARRAGESFGDFCDRMGPEALAAFADGPDAAAPEVARG